MKNLRILIVEANIHFSAALARVMERDGHTIVGTADHALGAMALAIAFKPDLALVEVNLSDGCSGAELGNLLARQGISVLFVTAARNFTPASDANIVGVLAKPAGDTALLAAVRSVLPRDARSRLDGEPVVTEHEASAEPASDLPATAPDLPLTCIRDGLRKARDRIETRTSGSPGALRDHHPIPRT